MTTDIVDQIAGVTPQLDALRRRRPVTREQLQASFDALFRPVSTAHVSPEERELIAAFATALAGGGADDGADTDATAAFYAARAADLDADRAAIVQAEAAASAVAGPFGSYTELGLQHENTDGARYTPSESVIAALGERLAAALAHTHLLVLRPREAAGDDLGRLLDAGWTPDGIVTLSQLVSFLAFQQRVVAGLQVLSAAGIGEQSAHDSEEEAA